MQKILSFSIYVACFLFCLFVNSFFVFAETNDSMFVQVDLIGFGSGSSEIGIEVPDLVDLGELKKSSLLSSEEGIQINNTGTIDIRVTPLLNDPDEEIFKYLYFRKQQSTSTNNTDLVTFKKIGEYYLDINKPTTGKTFNHAHSYMQLNLTDFTGRINDDIDNYRAEILFLATAR